ncbi:MAG: glycosyltransferase family 2 protein [Thermoanaerobaculia bacterium]
MLIPLWRWRLRHPLRFARALVPRVVPLRARATIVHTLRPDGARSWPWGDPAVWREELAAYPPHGDPSPRPDAPLVSIHVIAYGNAVMTQLCVESLLRLTDYPNYEVIVVDNASQDGTADLLVPLTGDPRLRLVVRETNAGFPAACNEAIAGSRGEVICILNNDVVVTPHWLSDLVAHLQLAHDVGMVGPVTNSSGNEARVPARYRSFTEMLAEAEVRRTDRRGEAFEIPMLGLYCVAMWRRVWNEVGPLDEQFEIGMFEDDDYARRLRQRGYGLACREDVLVHHWGGAAFGLAGTRRYFEIYARNRDIFRRKWSG